MFIVQKGTDKYLIVEETSHSTAYGYTDDINKATKFASKDLVKISLKRSGFLAHSGLKIIEVD
jgi:hypothetical protein